MTISNTEMMHICDWYCESGLEAYPNGTYMKTRKLPCEFGITLKLGPRVPLA